MCEIEIFFLPAGAGAAVHGENTMAERPDHPAPGAAPGRIKHYLLVCTGGGCIASGALQVKAALEEELGVSLFARGARGARSWSPA